MEQKDICSFGANGIMSYTEFLQNKLNNYPRQLLPSSHRPINPAFEYKFNNSLVTNLKAELFKASNIISKVKGQMYDDSIVKTSSAESGALSELKNANERQKRVIEEMNSNNDIINQNQKKELKASEIIIKEKSKNIGELMDTLKKEIEMNKALQSNCERYDMMVQTMLLEKEKLKQKSGQSSQSNKNQNELTEENSKLKEELKKRDNLIKKIMEEMKEKEKIFNEIFKMKEDVIGYATKLEQMTKKLSNKEEIIKQLQSKQSNNNSSIDYKAKWENEVEKNANMVKKIEELSNSMSSIEHSEESLMKKYESLAMDFSGERVNKVLIEENKELKKMNQELISKMEGLPELEQKFKELFDEIISLKMENDMLKKKRANLKSATETDLNKNPDEDDQQQLQNENENEEEEELAEPLVVEDLNLYCLYQSSFLCFNISKRQYSIVNPKGMKSLFEIYQQIGSSFYNTLQGLFILTGKQFNELFYFSQKSDSINRILSFSDNHQNGELILNEETKQLVVLSGSHTNSVEKLAIEQGKIFYLPSMTQRRIKSSCCYINRILYVFFGYNPEQNKCISTIEYLDINSDKKDNKWEIVNLQPKGNLEIMNHSVICLTDKQVLIFGGVNGNMQTNTNVIFYDNETNLCDQIQITLKTENNPALFSINPLFKDYCSGNTLSFANIDDSFNIHLFNSSLEHEVIQFNLN